jgi:hypothetical protein
MEMMGINPSVQTGVQSNTPDEEHKDEDLNELNKEPVSNEQICKSYLEEFRPDLPETVLETVRYPEVGKPLNIGDICYISVRIYNDTGSSCHVETLDGRTKLLINKSYLAK